MKHSGELGFCNSTSVAFTLGKETKMKRMSKGITDRQKSGHVDRLHSAPIPPPPPSSSPPKHKFIYGDDLFLGTE